VIAGWTGGSRVDVYLDGPAGVGQGIGSTIVGAARPDVAGVMHDPTLAQSGYNLWWSPTDLSAGPHTLYVYSLVDGKWMLQMVPIAGVGNVVNREVGSNNDRDSDSIVVFSDSNPTTAGADAVTS
ncbi:MAG: hypothetical protein QOF51_1196, partial [Chloroflexota bacterium]|nr:hypothetical protein [Chloroflexota bacterium]